MLQFQFYLNCIYFITIVPHSTREETTVETYDRKSVDKLTEALKVDEEAGNVRMHV